MLIIFAFSNALAKFGFIIFALVLTSYALNLTFKIDQRKKLLCFLSFNLILIVLNYVLKHIILARIYLDIITVINDISITLYVLGFTYNWSITYNIILRLTLKIYQILLVLSKQLVLILGISF